MAEQPAPEVWSFPTNPDEFDADDRISFSKLDNRYIAVQEDGTEYEFDGELKRWIPTIDESLIEQQRSGYGNVEASEDAAEDDQRHGKKRKKDEREVSCY
jgi:HIV Tat-specific factor 1